MNSNNELIRIKEQLKIDGVYFKIFAMICMAIDHVGAFVFPDIIELRIIGRLAFPIFAYFIAEGAWYTKNIRQYEIRLLVTAIISEAPFDYLVCGKVLYWGYQNTIFTLLLGVIVIDVIKNKGVEAGVIAAIAAGVIAQYGGLDYGAFGVMLIILLYLFKNQLQIRELIGAGFTVITNLDTIEVYAAISFVLLLFYNGKRGRQIKWLFYGFYPLHLSIIALYLFLN